MKSIVTPRDEKQIITYPCLMNSKDGDIVLFLSSTRGVVINNRGNFPLGHTSELWASHHFSPFHGTVTLEND